VTTTRWTVRRQKHQGFYLGLDRRTLIGEEEVSVRAGTFRTKRYRYKTRFDETVDVWINDTLWPMCLIKLDAELKQPWFESGRFNYRARRDRNGRHAEDHQAGDSVRRRDPEKARRRTACACARRVAAETHAGPDLLHLRRHPDGWGAAAPT
jgi:hypothetical protein